jgi:hypothetical protein
VRKNTISSVFLLATALSHPGPAFSKGHHSPDLLPQNWDRQKPQFTLAILGTYALTGISDKDFGGIAEGLLRWRQWYAIGIQTSYVRLSQGNDNWYRVVLVGDVDILDAFLNIYSPHINFFLRGDFGYARVEGHNAVEVVAFGLGTNVWLKKKWAVTLLGTLNVDVGSFGLEDNLRGGFMLSSGLRYAF